MDAHSKITPHLWFATQAKQAAEWYCSIFPQSKIESASVIKDTPSGNCDLVSFRLWGMPFRAISAGPLFQFNPSISFMVRFDSTVLANAKQELDRVWSQLIDGGTALMPLASYPFSAHYGWVQDKFGLSWQLMLTGPTGPKRPPVVPTLLMGKDSYGKAAEAVEFYLSVFENAPAKGGTGMGQMSRRGSVEAPEKAGTVSFADFQISGQWMGAMESISFTSRFNEAVSLMVECATQSEIDYFWSRLSVVKESEQCGWCKDPFGVSWQVVPAEMSKLMGGTPEQTQRVTQAFLKMKKFDLAQLRKAFEGK